MIFLTLGILYLSVSCIHKIKNYFVSSENRSAITHSVYTPLFAEKDREENGDTITVERSAETVTEASEHNAIIHNRVPFINRLKCSIVQLVLLSYLNCVFFLTEMFMLCLNWRSKCFSYTRKYRMLHLVARYHISYSNYVDDAILH